MDEKIKSTIQKIKLLSEQNLEFKEEMQKMFSQPISASIQALSDNRFSEIYEYCLAKKLRAQAEDLYKEFPIYDECLVEDYIRMETFRRADNFGDFCLALYQQIECITNHICTDPIVESVVKKMWGKLAFYDSQKGARKGHKLMETLFFYPNDIEEKKKSQLNKYSAIEKIAIVIYLFRYETKLENWNEYLDLKNTYSGIYQCRNLNHRGNEPTENQKKQLDSILADKSFSYFKFLGMLALYVDSVKKNYLRIKEIEKFI